MLTEYDFSRPLVNLLGQLAKRRRFKHVYIEKGPVRLEINRP